MNQVGCALASYLMTELVINVAPLAHRAPA